LNILSCRLSYESFLMLLARPLLVPRLASMPLWLRVNDSQSCSEQYGESFLSIQIFQFALYALSGHFG
jgi:hypothetical protein